MLWQTLGHPPLPRLELKAMILICLWPFPTSSMSEDQSYILASATKASATHIGLHKPHIVEDFSRARFRLSPEELYDALMMWSACFIAAEWYLRPRNLPCCIWHLIHFTVSQRALGISHCLSQTQHLTWSPMPETNTTCRKTFTTR